MVKGFSTAYLGVKASVVQIWAHGALIQARQGKNILGLWGIVATANAA